MSENIEQLIAYKKAINIINSCSIVEQIPCAKIYIELFNDKYGDFSNYNDLKRRLIDRIEELKIISNGQG